jgi:hypothetical protein
MVGVRPAIVVLAAALCVSGLAPTAAFAQGEPAASPIDYGTARLERRIDVVRADGEITLDGALDEPSWGAAPVATNFIQNEPREGVAATFDTEVRVLYDDNALYFGVFARDDEPARLMVTDIKKDFNTDNSDSFRIILDTFRDERNGYQFATNPAGAKWDSQMANEGRENNADWDGIWDVATRVVDRGWYAEIRIPFRTLKFTRDDLQIWGMNFERKIRRLNEDSHWAPLPRIYDLSRVSLAGTVEGLRGVRPGRNIRVKPYASATSSTLRGTSTAGDFDGGLDVKYGVTTGLVWDFTVNTDFSQAEADEQQINLTRFSLFFPEKRDFFLENSGIFQFGGGGVGGPPGGFGGRLNSGQEMRLFFSRRIGLSDNGEAIPILGGTRLTGRQGRYSLGVLSIQQRDEDAVPSTNFTAMRVRRDILANSDIGVMVLNKDEVGSHYNRVAGVDANFRFGSYLTANTYATRSFSPGAVTRPSGNPYATRAGASYSDRTYQVTAMLTSIGEQFNDEMGFVPRVGIHNSEAQLARRFRPAAMSRWCREIRPHWVLDQYNRQADGTLESRYQDWHLPCQFQAGGMTEIGVNTYVEDIRTPFLLNSARRVAVGPGRYEFNEKFILLNTSAAYRFALSSRFGAGEFYDGYRRSYSLGPSVRLNENLNAAVTLQVNDVTAAGGDFVTKLITTRVNYNFSTKVFLNALLQYNNDNSQWTSNVRFNIIHRPLSDFFLVYNERRDERTGQMLSRALIAKMTYLVAF